MAQYNVPQDVEADDKLLGPFTFRQFVYIMIIGGLCGVGVLFWGIFPPLIIVLVPPILLLGALALPLKKDQPMETYLSAVVSFYLKPHIRIWEPGEPESTITITAPKQVEEKRTKDLDQDEAVRRLSFLADIIDTEGYAIKGVTPNTAIKEEIKAEANDTYDMFDNPSSSNVSINQTLQTNASTLHTEAVNQMRAAIENNSLLSHQNATITSHTNSQPKSQTPPLPPQTTSDNQAHPIPAPTQITTTPEPPALPENPVATNPTPTLEQDIADNPLTEEVVKTNDVIIKPDAMVAEINAEKAEQAKQLEKQRADNIKETEEKTDPNIINLANNTDFSIETIAQQAKRIKEKKDDEVYISLH